MGIKSKSIRNLLLAAATVVLAACGSGEGVLDSYTAGKDPDQLLAGCFHGNSDGQCTSFEAIYGIDPRVPNACGRLVDRLPGCEDSFRKARGGAGSG